MWRSSKALAVRFDDVGLSKHGRELHEPVQKEFIHCNEQQSEFVTKALSSVQNSPANDISCIERQETLSYASIRNHHPQADRGIKAIRDSIIPAAIFVEPKALVNALAGRNGFG